MNLYDIIEAVEAGRRRETVHARDEARNDRIDINEVWFSVVHGEILEDYPDDRPHPSCLIYGRSSDGSPIHSVVAYNQEERSSVLVTVYRPDPARWIDWRTRRRRT